MLVWICSSVLIYPYVYRYQRTYRHVCMCAKSLIVSDSATLWTIVCQASLSVGFSRQEYWSELPCAPPEDLFNPGIKPVQWKHRVLTSGQPVKSFRVYLCDHSPFDSHLISTLCLSMYLWNSPDLSLYLSISLSFCIFLVSESLPS